MYSVVYMTHQILRTCVRLRTDCFVCYHSFLSFSDIIGGVPQLDEVLELYYHCKTCSEPQAYLEQAIFLEHVQDNHPEYIKQETEEEQKFVYVYSSDIKTEVICMYIQCLFLAHFSCACSLF